MARALGAPLIAPLDRHIKNVLLNQYLVFGDESRLTVHESAIVHNALFNLSSGTISVGPFCFFSHSVSLLTGKHDYSRTDRERQLSIPTQGGDIVIGRGAWLAANVTVLGPCVIGEHAVVAAGSVVTSDVPSLSLVAGVPARVLRQIELGAGESRGL